VHLVAQVIGILHHDDRAGLVQRVDIVVDGAPGGVNAGVVIGVLQRGVEIVAGLIGLAIDLRPCIH